MTFSELIDFVDAHRDRIHPTTKVVIQAPRKLGASAAGAAPLGIEHIQRGGTAVVITRPPACVEEAF
jgi:hypothetical protein